MKLKLFALLCLVSVSALAQTKADIFKPEVPVTWLGLDFSAAFLIGDRERYGSESDVRHLMQSWNDLMLKEPDNFDIAAAIDRKKVTENFDIVKSHNAELDVLSMLSDDEKNYMHLRPGNIDEILATYDFSGLSGMGLIFIVEGFSKPNKEGAVWATFFNLQTKEVLLTERLVAAPGGAGMRNFWAGAIKEMIIKIDKKEFARWRKTVTL